MKALTDTIETSDPVLVAGGAGFLGSHLCDRLIDAGRRVICLDSFLTGSRDNVAHLLGHERFRLVEHDVCEPLPRDLRVSAVFNLACAASPPRYQADPVHTMMTSVLGTKHLLDVAEQSGARYLQASTSEVYGDPERHPQSEDYWGNVNPTGPRACYDEGKRAAEALIFDYLRLGRVDARVARIFNTYGPRMDPDDGRIVSNLVCQALTGRPLTIYGTGEQTRSFCYVSDLVDGLQALMAVDRNPAAPVNLGNPGEFTINELADLVFAAIPTASRIVHLPLPKDDPQRRRPDIARARSLLGWSPKVPLADGLPATIRWFAGRLGVELKPRRRAGAGKVAAALHAAGPAE
jgi:UDP-glucuronate decarboxylase